MSWFSNQAKSIAKGALSPRCTLLIADGRVLGTELGPGKGDVAPIRTAGSLIELNLRDHEIDT